MVSEEQIEQDELNGNECMLSLMKLLDHMEHNKINPEAPKVPVYVCMYASKQADKQTVAYAHMHTHSQILDSRRACMHAYMYVHVCVRTCTFLNPN